MICKLSDHLNTMLRSLVLLRMSTFGHERTIQEAKKRLDLHISGDQVIPADLRSVVYKAVLAAGGEETFDSLIKVKSNRFVCCLIGI
jgi:puromycin-sensitive aminopeptidase